MIVVTGATGQLGRDVVEALLARRPTGDIAVSVRDPAKAADIAERGVQVRRGDFADPASLAAAFGGADQVLLISADKLGDEALRLHHAAIAAARKPEQAGSSTLATWARGVGRPSHQPTSMPVPRTISPPAA